ncbi:MAG: acyl-CoA dehydrogenase [Deltaproteobacteria bacterium]|nr:MAG: acyl-CoA dehydrogenase [Deltaproteobacteria bacterium]
MDFELREEHLALEQMVREFTKKEVIPHAREWDEKGEIPSEVIRKVGDLGLFGVCIPEEYGGAGMDTISYAIAVKEIGAGDGSLGLTVASHNSLCSGHILHAGSEEQKKRFLPRLASGEVLGAWCLTEPNSGSDAASMKTRAEKVEGGWKLNGSKMFITQGSIGGVYVILAVTDREKGKDGITAFVAEKGTEGLIVGKKLKKLGMRASDTAEVVFEDLFLPDDAVLGEEGKGFWDTLSVLNGGRISIAALSVGIGMGAMREAINYAKERQQFGQPIANFQAIQWMIADAMTRLEAAWLLTLRAAFLKDAGKPFVREASMAKLFASEASMDATIKAVQIHGGYGYTEEYSVEKFMRDAKLCEIGEGTSEIQRIVISKQLIRG